MKTKFISARALGVAAVALMLVVGAAGQASAAPVKRPAAVSKHFTLNTALSGVTFQGESVLSNGDYAATWKTPTLTVKVAAPSGSTVTLVDAPAGSAEVGVTLPAGGVKPAQFPVDQLNPARSIVPDAIAVGYTPAQASALVPGITPFYTRGQIIATPCASVTGDSNWAYGRACDTQKFVQDNGGGNWILGDEVVGSGNDPCCKAGTVDLTRLAAWVSYGAYNKIFHWSPNATIATGNCINWTASLSYNGVGMSAQTTICSDRLDPIYVNSGTRFGSAWSGCDRNAYVEGTASADIDNNPAAASPNVTMWVSISWANC